MGKSHSFVFYEDTKIWNQDSITFYFIDGSPQQKSEVKEFAKLWQKYTGIKFNYTNQKPSFFTFKKYYTISFKGNSNESTRGAINGTINLGHLSENIIFRKTTILHEFGHMLGLGHEHQRYDRPKSLDDNTLISDCVQNQQQSKSWCKENLFNKNKTEVFIQSIFDPQSIMHYEIGSIRGDLIRSKDNINSLSYTDKHYIAMLYNQNIDDKTLEKMHKQDLWLQSKFEIKANKNRERKIMQLSSPSCKPLQYPNKSKDGKYCEGGFMIIDIEGYSFANDEFKSCYTSYKEIKEKLKNHNLCQLSSTELDLQKKKWSRSFAQFGNCKRLETNKRNNQEFFCKQGFSIVTKNNNVIGDKTICHGSEESVFLAMKENPICKMNQTDFANYETKTKNKLARKLKTKHCKVVKKKYRGTNCPTDFDYTIINNKNPDTPINNKCFASQYQAINAMNRIKICQP